MTGWHVGSTPDIGFDGLTHSEVVVYRDELYPRPDSKNKVSLDLAEAGHYINILEERLAKIVEVFYEFAENKSTTIQQLGLEVDAAQDIFNQDAWTLVVARKEMNKNG